MYSQIPDKFTIKDGFLYNGNVEIGNCVKDDIEALKDMLNLCYKQGWRDCEKRVRDAIDFPGL